jgi:hypothetical protein
MHMEVTLADFHCPFPQNLPEESVENQTIEIREQNVIISSDGSEEAKIIVPDGTEEVQIASVDAESSVGQIE